MRVAVLGGTRFIGFHLVNALLRRGDEVALFNRGRSREPEPFAGPVARARGDRDRPETLAALFDRRYDALIDLSGFTPEQVRPLAESWREKIGHYLFCSSSSAYRVPPPGFDENAPLESGAGYGGQKAAAERLLLARGRETGWPVTVLRPQGVFGPFAAEQPLYALRRLRAGAPVPLRPETLGKRINLLWVHDLAAAFLAAMGNPRAFGEAFNLAGAEACDPEGFVAACAAAAGVERFSTRPDESGLPWLSHELVADIAKARRLLGFAPTPLAQALESLWTWCLDRPGCAELSRWRRLAGRLYGAVQPIFARSTRS